MGEECCQCGRELKDNKAYSVFADVTDLKKSKICYDCYKEILDNTEGKCYECKKKISSNETNLIITTDSLIVLDDYTDEEEEDVFVCPLCSDEVRNRIIENSCDFDGCLSLIVTIIILAIIILVIIHFGW